MTHRRRSPLLADAPVLERRTRLRPSVLRALAAVVALLGLIGVLRLGHGDDVLRGVTVAGVEAGGMSADELRGALVPVAEAAGKDAVTLVADGREHVVAPDEVGYTVDVQATVERAMGVGRDGSLLRDTWSRIAALWRTVEVPLEGRTAEAALDERLDAIASAVDVPVSHGDLDIDPSTLEVTAVTPTEGLRTEVDAAREDVLDAFATPGAEALELPVTIVRSPVTLDDVEAVAEVARGALEAPFTATLPSIDEVVTLPPAQLAPLLTVAPHDRGIGAQLAIDAELVEDAFGAEAGVFDVPATDATWDLPRDPGVVHDELGDTSFSPEPVDAEVIPSRPGREFDAGLVADQMAASLTDGAHHAEFDLPVVAAAFTTDEAEAFGVTELIGTFTSHHAPGEPRVQNIQTLADVVDGTRIAPGEQFSINQLSGERTCDKGYAEDAMILGGKMVDVCGGGVSQFGTTMLNAAWFSGVRIDEHKPHSHYIGRYPEGREATLNYPSPDIDVRWTNDTGHGVLVRTSYTDTSITVSLYGTSRAASVGAEHGAAYNHRPARTTFVEDRRLEPGESRTVERGIAGFDVEVDRILTWKDGATERETYRTRYVAVPEVVRRNSAKPEPEPAPSPKASPEDPERQKSEDGSSEQEEPSGGGSEPSGDSSASKPPLTDPAED